MRGCLHITQFNFWKESLNHILSSFYETYSPSYGITRTALREHWLKMIFITTQHWHLITTGLHKEVRVRVSKTPVLRLAHLFNVHESETLICVFTPSSRSTPNIMLSSLAHATSFHQVSRWSRNPLSDRQTSVGKNNLLGGDNGFTSMDLGYIKQQYIKTLLAWVCVS